MYKKLMIVSLLVFGFALAEQYLPGEIIVQFDESYRSQINLQVIDGKVTSGLERVDNLIQKWHITGFRPLINPPDPYRAEIEVIRHYERAKDFALDLLYSLYFPRETDVWTVVDDFKKIPEIKFVGPNYILPVDFIPNDPMFTSQWHLTKTQCPLAWDTTTGNPEFSVMVIDQGVDYNHDDLRNTFKINTREDINNNGFFDPWPASQGGDLNGVDDDGNGYADDVIGYDFVGGDPNPIPEGGDDHGTLCAGVIVATINNNIGVASYAGNCKQVVARAGSGGGIYTSQAISAKYYAVIRGVNVINMSYGGSTYYGPADNAIQYCWQGGIVLTASAGNNYSYGAPRYPACYNNVIACAASDPNDMRSVWGGGYESNYAPWVDVTAPGTQVLTTGNGNTYQAPDGTSFSAPCVAGLALLIKSMYPTMTNAQCTLRIFQSCDSMPDPQYLAGNLGRGRINATKAIYQPIRCNLKTISQRLNDGNNHYPQAGETVAIITTLCNERGYQNATNIVGTLYTDDPGITIIKNTATYPTIPAGQTGSCSADSFLFFVSPNFIPHRVRFVVQHTATPPTLRTADTFYVTVGDPRILLVDDDGGRDYERWYKEAIDSLKTLYALWTTTSSGSPPLETLLRYPVVVWFTGLESLNTLTVTDQNNLTTYLNHGKNLFICGQNLGQDIGTTPFYSNYLRAAYVTTHTGQLFVIGIPGDPLGGVNGDTIVLGGAGGAANATSCDGIRPVAGASGSFRYRNYADTTVYGAIHFSGTYKVVYFGMPFEAINHSPARYIQKWEIMRRILAFFNEPLPQCIEEKTDALVEIVHSDFNFNVYPNPGSNRITIQLINPSSSAALVNIYDVNGRLVKTFTINQEPKVIWDCTDHKGNKVRPGIYFCEVRSNNTKEVKKTVVLR
jgi:hypothetical protein